jgi:hypothetical protein
VNHKFTTALLSALIVIALALLLTGPSTVSANQHNGASPAAHQDSTQQKRESAELALNQSLTLYTGELARYTFWLVIVGAMGGVIALLQAMFLFASIQEYLRPKVHIRTFNMINDLRTHMQDKAPFRFALVLVNHGGSRAKVKSGNFTIRTTPTREIPTFSYGEPTYRPSFIFLQNEIIPCGPDSYFEQREEQSYSVREIQDLIEEKAFLHIIGFIWYKGHFQLRGYKLAFARRYDAKNEKLIPYGDPEFEFTD